MNFCWIVNILNKFDNRTFHFLMICRNGCALLPDNMFSITILWSSILSNSCGSKTMLVNIGETPALQNSTFVLIHVLEILFSALSTEYCLRAISITSYNFFRLSFIFALNNEPHVICGSFTVVSLISSSILELIFL